jgi:hypothetical protein
MICKKINEIEFESETDVNKYVGKFWHPLSKGRLYGTQKTLVMKCIDKLSQSKKPLKVEFAHKLMEQIRNSP